MRTTSALAALASLLITSAAPAGTILVDLNGGGHYLTIGEAVQAAVDGDSLLVAPGQYVGANNRAIDPGDKNLVIIGVAGPDSTIIDCERLGRGFIFAGGQDSTCVVSVTFEGNYGEATGGLRCESGSAARRAVSTSSGWRHRAYTPRGSWCCSSNVPLTATSAATLPTTRVCQCLPVFVSSRSSARH